jgi:hypothetical protein
MRRALALALALGLLAVPSAVAKPPSFALWWARWNVQSDQLIVKVSDACTNRYGNNDGKLGPCFVKGMIVKLHTANPDWLRQVARLARGQSPACKKAIHGYYLAFSKLQKANLIFLNGHSHTKMTDLASSLREDRPYVTLRALNDGAKSRAIDVCG